MPDDHPHSDPDQLMAEHAQQQRSRRAWRKTYERISLALAAGALLFNLVGAHPLGLCLVPVLGLSALATGAAGLDTEFQTPLLQQPAAWGMILGVFGVMLFLVIQTFFIGL